MMDDANPVLAEVTRGPLVESWHRGAAVAVDATGKRVRAWGDVERPIYPRSANKPLQAIALLETGAAARWGLSDAEVALACASHHGEPRHTEAVAAWLARCGLGADALECGAHAPYDEATAAALIRTGQAPSALHNNCSGKHTGFLATAAHLGEPTRGYIDVDHPVQRRVARTVAELCGLDVARLPFGIDGCGIPTYALPLEALARGMAQLADPSRLAPERAAAARRIVRAITANPMMIGGTDSLASRATAALDGTLIVKSGAEGVYAAVLPAAGWAVALKIDDGTPRARDCALLAVLARLGVLDTAQIARLDALVASELLNRAGRAIGAVRPGPAFDA
ncbi:MAG TPA: asparaginase [Candidatus Sulfotelmatobacter sp.]|nr:asparaginase [Candidatus Sulfotelmatobacter sp.]